MTDCLRYVLILSWSYTSSDCKICTLIVQQHFLEVFYEISFLSLVFLWDAHLLGNCFTPRYRKYSGRHNQHDGEVNTYTLFDGLAYNTCGYFAS